MKKESKGNQLLWIVGAAFAAQIIVWVWWLNFAQHHQPKQVPLATNQASTHTSSAPLDGQAKETPTADPKPKH